MGTAYNTNVVTDGLVGCWDAGNRRSYPGAGLDWTDLAGGANGFITNSGGDAIDFIDEKGGYLDFDGGDDYVACPQPNYDTTGDWSWCMWLNRITSGAPTYPVWYGYGNDPGTRIFWYDAGSGVIKLGLYSQESGNNSSTRPVITTRFPANEWSMFALKKEGNSVYFCVDADEWTEIDRASSNWGSDEFIWRDIGQSLNGYYWHGYIASVYMYNRGINLDEVKQSYEATKSRFAPRIPKEGLVGNWDAGDPLCFDGNMVNHYTASTYNLKDLSSGNIGQFKNMVPLENFSLDNGGYWEFDGTDDRFLAGIDASSNDMYNVYSNANGFTAAMWVNRNGSGDDETFFWKNHVYQFRYDGNQKLNLASGDGSNWGNSDTDLVSSASLLSDNTWHFVVGLVNKSNDAREIWLDGVRVANDTGSSMLWGTDGEYLGVGAMPGAGARPLEGKIAMATLYGRALSAAEIKDFYNKTKARFGH